MAQAKKPVRFCGSKLLSETQYSASTEEFILYLKVLLDEREIRIGDLDLFLRELKKEKLINPISTPSKNKTYAFHHEQFEKIIAQSKDLILKQVATELEQIKNKTETTEKQKDQTNQKTTIAHYEIKFVPIPAGKFMMGEEGAKKKVEIKHPFEIMNTEVTQYMWVELMGENPSYFKEKDGSMKPNHPVENITWYSAAEFANRLSIKNGLPPVYDFSRLKFDPSTKPEDGSWALIKDKEGNPTDDAQSKNIIYNAPNGDVTIAKGYILPPEEYQEYLMSNLGQSKGKYHYGDDENELGDYAWYNQNSNMQTQEVMQKKTLIINGNPIYDIIGNVWNWSHNTYNSSGSHRVIRGGGWYNDARLLRSAFRNYGTPDNRWNDVGFRLLRALPE